MVSGRNRFRTRSSVDGNGPNDFGLNRPEKPESAGTIIAVAWLAFYEEPTHADADIRK